MAKRWIEMIILFVLLPGAAILSGVGKIAIPLLVAIAGYCWLILQNDPGFDRTVLHRPKGFAKALLGLLPPAAIGAVAMSVLVLFAFPELWLSFPRHRPWLWLMVMLIYPVVSVVPQELVYRVFFLHRYERLFPTPWAACVASATLFGLHHYIFHNWLAVALTLLGGIKFVLTYRRSRSLPLTCVEHAIYGCLVFTVGLGVFFHGGSASVLTDMRGLAR